MADTIVHRPGMIAHSRGDFKYSTRHVNQHQYTMQRHTNFREHIFRLIPKVKRQKSISIIIIGRHQYHYIAASIIIKHIVIIDNE